MEEKSPDNEPVEKTDKCSLYSGKEPKKNGNAEHNWPEPEFRTSECRTIIHHVMGMLFAGSYCKNRPGGGRTRHIYANSFYKYINFIFLIY